MQDIFKTFERLFDNVIPKDIKYVFKEKYETDQTYEFIMIVEEKDLDIFKSKKSGGLINSVINMCNSEISNFSKKIVIDLEVLELYA
ncbi:hypothetical protein [Spiroplasma sp. BIUS-1]|uniref:hypothetical protein n=1 Tax=Spiroplasma sp. BIUS-1 TaxID=216964 RepID=UPI0013996CE3|nr:hypothetical protein [Spiroplasma sp. BIUS-1]QHX36527.1 hypothetical protein SBIUS_v1c02740 [Spiroplasma sp. BIUS-1]